MKNFLVPERNGEIKKQKNIYTYRDNSKSGEPIVFETVASSIINADEKYEKAKGINPGTESHIGCSVESLRTKQERDFQMFIVNVLEKDGITWKEYAEQEEKNIFDNYSEMLDLTLEILKDKKILDIGADKCLFAGYCAKYGISTDVYSIEGSEESYDSEETKKALWSDEIRNIVEGKTKRALAQRLPFEDGSFELVLNNSAMPGRDKEQFGDLTMEEDLDRSYDEIIRVLKPGGEARLAPFDANEDDEYFGKWAIETRKKLEQLLVCEDVDIKLEKMEDGKYRIVIKKLEYAH